MISSIERCSLFLRHGDKGVMGLSVAGLGYCIWVLARKPFKACVRQRRTDARMQNFKNVRTVGKAGRKISVRKESEGVSPLAAAGVEMNGI